MGLDVSRIPPSAFGSDFRSKCNHGSTLASSFSPEPAATAVDASTVAVGFHHSQILLSSENYISLSHALTLFFACAILGGPGGASEHGWSNLQFQRPIAFPCHSRLQRRGRHSTGR